MRSTYGSSQVVASTLKLMSLIQWDGLAAMLMAALGATAATVRSHLWAGTMATPSLPRARVGLAGAHNVWTEFRQVLNESLQVWRTPSNYQ